MQIAHHAPGDRHLGRIDLQEERRHPAVKQRRDDGCDTAKFKPNPQDALQGDANARTLLSRTLLF
jgi:hypothetical protein